MDLKPDINIKQLGKGWSAERYGFASWKYAHKTGAYLVKVGGFSDEWELDSWESWLLVRSGHLSIRVNSAQEANRLVQESLDKEDPSTNLKLLR